MYQSHPSRLLSELFERKPYQGADPQAAQFLFVGLDANYAANIEANPISSSASPGNLRVPFDAQVWLRLSRP